MRLGKIVLSFDSSVIIIKSLQLWAVTRVTGDRCMTGGWQTAGEGDERCSDALTQKRREIFLLIPFWRRAQKTPFVSRNRSRTTMWKFSKQSIFPLKSWQKFVKISSNIRNYRLISWGNSPVINSQLLSATYIEVSDTFGKSLRTDNDQKVLVKLSQFRSF